MKITILIVSIKIFFVCSLTCEHVLQLPEDQKILLPSLQLMPPKDIIKCLAHLGKEELPELEANFIWKTIIKYYDGIENIPDSVLMILHWVTVAVTPDDYENITLNNIDVVQNFGFNYNLNDAQLSAIANRVRQDFAAKEPEDYTYYDLTALREILCAFNKSEIERIRPLAYKETALLIGKLERCNAETMSGFATLAVHRRAFGPIDDWTEGVIKIIGKVAEYLPQEAIARFNFKRNID